MFNDCDSKNITCFLCNHIFRSDEESWMIFAARLQRPLASILSSVLRQNIDAKTAHSIFLCNDCKTLILQFESLEKRFIEMRNEILNVYNRTAKLYNLAPIVFDGNLDLDVTENDSCPINADCSENEEEIEKTLPSSKINLFPDESLMNNKAGNKDKKMKTHQNDSFIGFVNKKEDNSNVNAGRSTPLSPLSDHNYSLHSKNISETKDKIITLNVCDKEFTNQITVESHWKYDHSKRIISKLKKSFTCEECGIRFQKKYQILKHINSRHTVRKCEVCNEKFLFKTDFVVHLNKIKNILCAERERTVAKTEFCASDLLQCVECGKFFCTKNSLRIHMQQHNKVRYQCDICNKMGFTQNGLKRHKKSHTDKNTSESLFECNICKSKFLNQNNLSEHLLTHNTLLENNLNLNAAVKDNCPIDAECSENREDMMFEDTLNTSSDEILIKTEEFITEDFNFRK